MRRFTAVCLGFLITICLFSCTNADNGKSDFAYYFAVDKAENEEVVLYAVMKKEVKGSEKDKNPPFAERYTGKSTENAFDSFFDKHKDAYTGTVKEYAVGEKVGKKGLEDFKVYLANSPRLPAKRKTVTVGDAALYIDEKIQEEQ